MEGTIGGGTGGYRRGVVEGIGGCMSESCHVPYIVLEGIGGCSGGYVGVHVRELPCKLYIVLEGIGGCNGGYRRVDVRELPCTEYSMRN